MDPSSSGGAFPPTAWTALEAIAAGGAEAPQALETVSRCYWKPVYVYLRRKGRPEAEAADLVQGFFVHLLEKDLLSRPERSQGRFRTWLRAVLEHFLANEARIAAALKRGGGRRPLPLDIAGGEEAAIAGGEISPEAAFDRAWAIGVLQRALVRLDREYRAAGKPDVLPALRGRFGLAGSAAPAEPVDGTTLHRARQRLRALVLDEVADGTPRPGEAESEVADLFRALGGKS